MYSKILVPIDGSEPSIRALDHTVSLSQVHGSEIQIISIIDELKLPFGAQYSLWAQDSHQELLRSSLESLNKEMMRVKDAYPDIMIDASIHEGDPSETIVRLAEDGEYDLIVMGKKGLNLIEDLVMGSVTRKVVKISKVTVAVVN
jgi:nucleotide-binding universal stress UspA family protein